MATNDTNITTQPGQPAVKPKLSGKIIDEGITFDDGLLLPARSAVVARVVDVSTRLTRNISIGLPLVSAPMDTVTESALAIALAQEDGIGIIHKNLSVEAATIKVNNLIVPTHVGVKRMLVTQRRRDAETQRLSPRTWW